ncbi:hypothetical protein L484_003502 [Morus notabilis]|uniref:Uncharacterized protein n=1 Tax=Morus notabilis TaxID=981085 RepID=W9SEN7_9ROSA|nr:hypothetical protein L484_003502 [Morus notabilis]
MTSSSLKTFVIMPSSSHMQRMVIVDYTSVGEKPMEVGSFDVLAVDLPALGFQMVNANNANIQGRRKK